MIAASRNSVRVASLGGLVLALTACAAFAQGGGGGGGSGGGGGGAGMNSKSLSVAGNVWSAGSNGKTFPNGTATLTYDAAQSARALGVQIGHVSLPDGSPMAVVFYDVIATVNDLGAPVYAYIPHLVGTMAVSGGNASLSVSTARGDDVPLFGPQGQVWVYTVDAAGNITGIAAWGNYVLTGGGGGGAGNP